MIQKVSKKFSTKERISYIIFLIGSFLGISLMNYGKALGRYNEMLLGLMIIFICDLAFCITEIRNRIVVFLFHLTIFLFLLSRIIVPYMQGSRWWVRYSIEANVFAMYAIAISMISIIAGDIGVDIFNKFLGEKEKKSKRKLIKVDEKFLFCAARVAFVICMVCFLVKEMDKLLIMSGHAYEEYYTIYKTRLPFVINFPANCMPYVLCIYLSFKPSKKESFFVLLIYIISALPMLKIGVRNPFILNALFAFVYYFLRDIERKNQEIWIGKFEKALIVLAVPVLIVFLGSYNYLRADEKVDMNVGDVVVDFMYKQGTTYDTVLQGYTYKDKLPYHEEQIYTLGAFSNYFYHNTFGRKIFGTEDLGNGNGLKAVYNGHSFSHAISYVVLGPRYIAGEGRGSSYIIENYLDFGYGGVAVFSIILGVICSLIPYMFGKHWLLSTIILNIVTGIFFVPRAESVSFLLFLISYQFWLVVIGVVILAIFFDKVCKYFSVKRGEIV